MECQGLNFDRTDEFLNSNANRRGAGQSVLENKPIGVGIDYHDDFLKGFEPAETPVGLELAIREIKEGQLEEFLSRAREILKDVEQSLESLQVLREWLGTLPEVSEHDQKKI